MARNEKSDAYNVAIANAFSTLCEKVDAIGFAIPSTLNPAQRVEVLQNLNDAIKAVINVQRITEKTCLRNN